MAQLATIILELVQLVKESSQQTLEDEECKQCIVGVRQILGFTHCHPFGVVDIAQQH